jgi:hypothetical protein
MIWNNLEAERPQSPESLDLAHRIQIARRELEESRARNRELIAAMRSVCDSLERLTETGDEEVPGRTQ